MPDSSANTRIALGTMLGGLIGLGGFVLLPALVQDADPWLRWGILFWHPTLGAVIAALSDCGPRGLPGWGAGVLVGGWMSAVLTFFAHGQMRILMQSILGGDAAFTSPFWFVLEGALVGALVGLAIDRFGTEDGPIGPD